MSKTQRPGGTSLKACTISLLHSDSVEYSYFLQWDNIIFSKFKSIRKTGLESKLIWKKDKFIFSVLQNDVLSST